MNVTSEILDQQPPSDVKAERGVIGSILLEPSIRETVSFLKPADFYLPAHGILFRVLSDMAEVDSVLLIARLRESGLLEEVGGTAYIAEVIHEVPVAGHALHYAGIVQEMARAREFFHLNCEALRALSLGRWPVEKLRDRLIERLREL